MDEQLDIKQLKGVIRRRKKIFVLTFLIVLLISGAIAFILPPIYRSKATILIEGQQIPEEYVKSTITGFVEERIDRLTRLILVGSRLRKIIEEFNLYPDMRNRYPMEDIVRKMRGDIKLETISAEVRDRRTGRPSNATIAFTISYEGKDPFMVQKITDVLASLYIEEETKTKEKRTTNTIDFFQNELDGLKAEIHRHEKEISEFKEANVGGLPEQNEMNFRAIERLERDLDQLKMQMRSLEDRKVYLKGQLALLDPLDPVVTESGKKAMNPKERLKSLRLQLISLQSRLSEKHPDIKKLKSEIKELEAQVGETDDSVTKIKRLKDLEGQLAALKGKLGPKHPDVIKLTREVEMLSEEVDQSVTRKVSAEAAEDMPDNPAYINLMTQIAAADIELKSLQKQKKDIDKKIEGYQKKIENAPLVEKEFKLLTLDYEGSKHKYDEIMGMLLEAKVSQGMEESERDERFSIAETPNLPEKPYRPNRIAIILIGFVLALGAGTGLAALQEYSDHSVKTVSDVSNIIGAPVFSVIPLMITDEERRFRRLKRITLALATVAVIVLALLWINSNEMPLDILWTTIQRKVMLKFSL